MQRSPNNKPVNLPLSVAFFPPVAELTANPYWSLLCAGLEERGVVNVDTREAIFGRRWLVKNNRTVNVIHFHFFQQFYAFELEGARLRWVMRFASNLILARMLGYRTVLTVHNLEPTYSLRPNWVDTLGHWVAVNLVERVIVHCDYARMAIRKRYGRKHGIIIAPHPTFSGHYPDSVSSLVARQQLELPQDARVFLFFGGIRPNKGVDLLITAFRNIPGSSLRLVIAGKPWPPDDYIVRLHSMGGSDSRISWHEGYVDDNDVQLFYRAADFVVLPFARILTSSSAVAAMSFARPVIVPALGCLPELVTPETGILYDPDSPSGLRDALIQSLVEDSEIMGEKACAHVRHYSTAAMVDATLCAYA